MQVRTWNRNVGRQIGRTCGESVDGLDDVVKWPAGRVGHGDDASGLRHGEKGISIREEGTDHKLDNVDPKMLVHHRAQPDARA